VAEKKEKAQEPRISVGGETVRMRFSTERQTKECRAIAVEGATYTRESDGSFIVSREHIQEMRSQGLDLAD
jgi:hypothetical protein